jgi:hypothetical protein
MQDYIIKNWTKGTVNRVEDETLPKGAASDSLNWLTKGDHIELRRGQTLMGASVDGAGRVTGLRVGSKLDGAATQVLFATYLRKLRYYDESTDDWVESGSDVLPAAASGEDVAMTPYSSLAGSFVYASSPNSDIYKVAVANPGDVTTLVSTSHRGKIRIKSGRMYLWDRKDANGGSDKSGLFRSWIDKDELSDFSFTQKEDVGTGAGGVSPSLTTLAFRAANAKATCMYVRLGVPKAAAKTITAISQASSAVVTSAAHGLSVGAYVTVQGVLGMTQINGVIARITAVSTDTFTVDVNSSAFSAYSSAGSAYPAEVMVDQRDGTLAGSDGGTGTVNYTTGAIAITAAANVTTGGKVYAEYYVEDATSSDAGTSNSGAIADFTKSSTRLAGEGFVLRQDDGGGAFQNLFTLGADEYCFHTHKTWKVTTASDDASAVNSIYRAKVGIEYWRAGFETGEGILYVDSTDPANAAFRRLQINDLSGLAVPKELSEAIDLSPYRFDHAVVYEWGDYQILACRTAGSAANDTAFVRSKIWDSWDRLDYRISCLETYNGTLVGGDSGSNNVFQLFASLSDEESNIPNSWTSGNDPLGAEGTKKVNRMEVSGLIGPDQSFDLQLSYDRGEFVTVQTIAGRGDYVDSGQRVMVGANVLGKELIGGSGGQGEGIEAYPFRHEFLVNTDRFQKLRYRLVAKSLGWLSVSEVQFKDIRRKGRRAAQKYVEPGA